MANTSAKKILYKNAHIRRIIKKYQTIISAFSFIIMLLSSFHLQTFIYFTIEMILIAIIFRISKPKYINGILDDPGSDLTRKGIISCLRDILSILWITQLIGLFFKYSYFILLSIFLSIYYEFRYRDAPWTTKW